MSDPEEHIGATRGIPADPKPTRKTAAAPVAPAPVPSPMAKGHAGETHEAKAALADLLGEPVPPAPELAPVSEVKKPSHSKVAVVRPRKEYEAAQLETAAARDELIKATKANRKAEEAEGLALNAWNAHPLNRPDPDAVVRAYLAREGEMRAANVANGLPPNTRGPTAVMDMSPLSVAARNRGRHAGGNTQQAGTPLRSNIARRNI